MITRSRAMNGGNGGTGSRPAALGSPNPAPEKEYLVTQRRPEAVLPLKWEFPGGKVEPGETDEQALSREMRERLGAEVRVGPQVSSVHHEYGDYGIDLFLYEAELVPGSEPRPLAVHAFRWVTSREFDELEFAAADEASLAKLLGIRGPSA